MSDYRVQVVTQGPDGPVVLDGLQDCDQDPCNRHGTCHCMCVCMPDQPDNCDDCAEAFGDDE